MNNERKTIIILEFLLFLNLWLLVNDLLIKIQNMTSYMSLIASALIIILLLNRKKPSKKK